MKLQLFIGAMALMISGSALAGSVLIVNGSSSTTEPDTTAAITSNLSTLHTAVGNTVTVSSDIPTDLSGYAQIWDIRFSDHFGLTDAQQTQYLGFLQGGGGMFLMGENSSFMSRNNSIFDFIGLVGGGSIGWQYVDSYQQVNAPFTGPNPVTWVDYAAPGGMDSAGSGFFITEGQGGGGSAVAWAVGDLSNALNGALTTVFDVNFMENNYGIEQQNLLKNLIGFVGDQVTPVPEPSAYAMLGIGLIGLGVLRRRKQAA